MPDTDDQQRPDGDDPAAAADPEAADTPEFTNRAARRARGKSTSTPPPAGKGPHLGGRGSVQGPRQWGNRRSG
jgi:hypothetical protein